MSKLGPQVGERVPDFSSETRRAVLDAAVHHGPEGRDARVRPLGRLVTVLQDAARRAARTCQGAQSTGSGARGDQLRLARDPRRIRRSTASRFRCCPTGLGDDQGVRHPEPVVAEAFGPNRTTRRWWRTCGIHRRDGQSRAARYGGMAFPGTFMVDRQGASRRAFSRTSTASGTRRRASCCGSALGGEAVAGHEGSTEQLDLTRIRATPRGAREPFLRRGRRYAEARYARLRARRGGYRVVTVNIATQPAFECWPARYPASEIYHFKPLNERVPVFQKPFTLVQGRARRRPRRRKAHPRKEELDHHRHARVPGVRRQDLLQPGVAAALMDGEPEVACLAAAARGRSASLTRRGKPPSTSRRIWIG